MGGFELTACIMVHPEGFEPSAKSLKGSYSDLTELRVQKCDEDSRTTYLHSQSLRHAISGVLFITIEPHLWYIWLDSNQHASTYEVAALSDSATDVKWNA